MAEVQQKLFTCIGVQVLLVLSYIFFDGIQMFIPRRNLLIESFSGFICIQILLLIRNHQLNMLNEDFSISVIARKNHY